MLLGEAPELLIIRLLCRIKNNADVHHNVDEQAFRRNEGAQILALFLETQRECAAGVNHRLMDGRVPGEIVPAFPRGEKEKAEIVNVAIVFAVFQQAGVMLGLVAPPLFPILGIDQPQLSAEKTLAPIRPRFAAMLPPAPHRVHRKKVGMGAQQMAQLLLCEGEYRAALVEQGGVGQKVPPDVGSRSAGEEMRLEFIASLVTNSRRAFLGSRGILFSPLWHRLFCVKLCRCVFRPAFQAWSARGRARNAALVESL